MTQRSSDRGIRIVAALILSAGIVACAVAIFSEQLGLGADVARGIFGWKRLSLLLAGAMGVASGGLLIARPQLGGALLDWDELERLDRVVRAAGPLVAAAGLSAAALAILAEELGVGAEAARGIFGSKRLSLLIAGGATAVLGALLFARPGIVSRILASDRARRFRDRIARHLRPLLSPSDHHLRYLAIGLLGLLGLVLLWTRLIHIDRSMWQDEVATALTYIGAGPGPIVFGEAGYSLNNHPLYSLLSWLTASLLGESEAIYRLWSVLPGIAAIGAGAWWAWRRIGPVVSVAFATIAVAAPLHLEYVTQARGYGLALLAATLTMIAADRLIRAYSTRTLLGFLGAGLLGIWTLLIFAIAFVGQALALLRWPKLRLPAIAVTVAAGLLSLAFYAPVLGEMFSSGGTVGAPRAGGQGIPLTAALLLDRPLEWLVIPTVTLLTDTGPRAALDSGVGVTGEAPSATWADVAVLAFVALGLIALWRRGDGGLALILLVPPLFFNLFLSLDDQDTVARHQLFLLPYIVVPVAVAIAELGRFAARPRILKPIVVGIGIVAVLALSKAIVEEEQGKALPRESFKQVAAIVNQTDIDTVVTDSFRPPGFRYYVGENLIEVDAEDLAPLLCQRSEVVYIHHVAYSASSSDPAKIECVTRKPSIRFSVPQRLRGPSIDVWIINPRS